MAKLVLANGCFDILHFGHVRHLLEARKMGDGLFVGITRDEFVNKGPDRPVFDENKRREVVEALSCVDGAFLCDSSIDALNSLFPSVWALGSEYKGKVRQDDWDFCAKWNIEIRFTEEETCSSTQVYDRLRRHCEP